MAISEKIIRNLECRLDDFNPRVRKENLEALKELADSGQIVITPVQEVANLHCHSFFSFNGYGYSPSHLAWLAKKHGLKYVGVVDFDVLDGVDEFLEACEFLGIRGTAGMETRVFIPEYAEYEINSPGEPGVCYYMGVGFPSSAAPSSAHRILEDIRLRVAQRNCRILDLVNSFLNPLYIDFERDILPMTPSGNATERHIVIKIVEKSQLEFSNPAQYWSEKLDLPYDSVQKEMEDSEIFQNTIRKKLMKRGGVGYIQPTEDTFPFMDEFNRVVLDCMAIPCAAWLDGTSQGEREIEKLLDVLIQKGTAAINVIPERNWNIKDPAEKAIKIDNLYHLSRVSKNLDLPILVGTEMNSFGQKIADDFNVPELAPLKNEFIDGANFIYGHTRMQRLFGMGYQSAWSLKNFSDRKSRNRFFIEAGKAISPKSVTKADYNDVLGSLTPSEVLKRLNNLLE